MLAAKPNKNLVVASLIALVLSASIQTWARFADNPTAAGTSITNRAEATYQDGSGETYNTISQTVTIIVASVSAVAVSPDETSPSDTVSPRERVTRLFHICNSGNNPDTFTLTRNALTTPAIFNALYFDNDGSGTITSADTLIRLNETASPQLPPGGCIGVLASIDTNDISPQSSMVISITARSNTANAAGVRVDDSGTIINGVGQGPRLTAPDDPNAPPSKLVNGVGQLTVNSGAQVTYTIAFRNQGDSIARNVIVADQLPSAIQYLAASLQLNDQNLSDAIDGDAGSVQNGRIEVHIATVNPGDLNRITFKAQLSDGITAGSGIVNNAMVSADNVAAIKSSNATVITNPYGLVFAGRAGKSAPIAGARVEVLQDQNGANLLPLPANVGFNPNEKNVNPFSTDAQGRFNFTLSGDQLGSQNSAVSYFLSVTAQNYVTRLMQLSLRPAEAGLFSLTVHALDNQPLAVAGGFDLVRDDVSLDDLATLALNVPMFEPSGLQIVKSADRTRAEIGDAITYRIEVHNPTAASINDVVVEDHLPASFNYAEGSALFGLDSSMNQPIAPEVQPDVLRFHLGEIPHGATAHLLYRVRVGVNARQGEQENLATASGAFASGEKISTAPARAVVFVSDGVFSTQQVLIGRVFVDTNGDGQFDSNDRPLPGVRLYLSNGQSVITDSSGLYNFPSLGDGPQVISLDPVTVPPGYALSDGKRLSGRSWTRLVRTPVGGGALLRQNFALLATNRLRVSSKLNQNEVDPNSLSAQSGAAARQDATGSRSDLPQSIATATPPANIPSHPATATNVGPGTYEVAAPESIEAVPPGTVRIISPKPNSVSMSPGLQVEVRVALDWTVKIEVNDVQVSEKNIGVRSLDHKNQVATFTFVGINIKPGPNRIRCTPIGASGVVGHAEELTVLGRGPAQRLEIISDQTEIQSGGKDSTIVRVKALDQWGNAALDGEVGVETSLGQLRRLQNNATETPKSSAPITANSLQPTTTSSQVVMQFENGEAALVLVSSGAPGDAKLRAQSGQFEAQGQVHISSEMRRPILVGLAEMSFGNSIPEVGLRGEQGNFRKRLSLFYSGRFLGNNMLTLSYDSQRPINRTASRDRMFQLDPLDRAYPLFGDSSTRYEAAQSNSKLYVRVDHKRSYAMFGDFETDMNGPLLGYSRKLTGVKAHLENSRGDFLTITGARPDTAFARDVFAAGSLGIIQLSNSEILPGSEVVVLEVRDRRNPEVIISHETLTRSVDYNLDALTGRLFFLRYISTFDSALNLTQIVVTYEHRAAGMNSAVYTARAHWGVKRIGLKLGFSAAMQRQTDQADFALGGVDAEKALPRGGSLQLAWAHSQGEILGTGNFFSTSDDNKHNGDAYQLTLAQPLPFFGANVRARFLNASAGFLNPFGATVTPGSRRGDLTFEMKPLKNSTLRFGISSERNKTANVDNERLTFSSALDQILSDRVRLHFGFDHRTFTDNLNDKTTDSNLITAGADVQATDKLQFSIKREQNVGDADPTYPTQTTLGATYQISALTKLFFTQRLAAAPITPIGDFTANGFAASSSRRETAVGVETRFGKYTSMTGRYQIENGINGTDSFAVIGLQDRLPITKQFSLDLGFERGFHLLGPNQSFDSATFGLGWQPNSDLRASARYEYRDRGGVGQLLAAGIAGKLRQGVTALSRFQFSRGTFGGKSSSSFDGSAALAIRPLDSDRTGVLFSYTHRSLTQDRTAINPTRDRIDSLATDGYRQVSSRLELYGRFALRFSANGQPDLPFVSTLSLLAQARAQYLLAKRWDWAVETRMLSQPSSSTTRQTYASELGFWLLPDMRLGGGYNFTAVQEQAGAQFLPARRGFYFTISSKLSNLFDLFGTSKNGLATSDDKSAIVKDK